MYYLFLTNYDSFVASERAGEYTITLPQALNLQGEWECSLKEITTSGDTDTFYIGVDFCEESLVGNKIYPVLRFVNASKGTWIFSDPYYLKVTRTFLNTFKLFIRDAHLKELEYSGTLACTLHQAEKMTTHVYDYETKKWVPYVADVDKYRKHFVAMSEGEIKPGRHIIKPPKDQETLKIVSPTAQALEMAKETVKAKKRRYDDSFSYKR